MFLAQALVDSRAPAEMVLRVLCEGEAIDIKVDNERPDDATIEHEGKTLLVLDEDTVVALSSKTLDIEETSEGPVLALVDNA